MYNRKPSNEVLTLVSSGRSIIGPVTVGRAVRMWRAYKMPAHMVPMGSQSWEVVMQDVDGNECGPVWQYTLPTAGRPMLWQRDAGY